MDRLTLDRLDALLDSMAHVRALVVGDLILDRYLSGDVERVSPEAPVPVVKVSGRRDAVGGAANVAANLAALGGAARVVGVVGDDEAGATLTSRLEMLGVDASGIATVTGRPTTEKTRVLALQQQIVRFDREDESDVSDEVEEALLRSIEVLLEDSDVLVLEDYNKGVLTRRVIRGALTAAERRGIPTLADPKRRNFFEYGGVTVFKPNRKELTDALGTFLHPDDPDWLERTRARLDCAHLLLTLGSEGMVLKGAGSERLRVPAVAQAVYDVSGAGDTVSATVALGIAAGASVHEAAAVANHAAAIEVSKAGVATVSPAEIRSHAAAHGP